MLVDNVVDVLMDHRYMIAFFYHTSDWVLAPWYYGRILHKNQGKSRVIFLLTFSIIPLLMIFLWHRTSIPVPYSLLMSKKILSMDCWIWCCTPSKRLAYWEAVSTLKRRDHNKDKLQVIVISSHFLAPLTVLCCTRNYHNHCFLIFIVHPHPHTVGLPVE